MLHFAYQCHFQANNFIRGRGMVTSYFQFVGEKCDIQNKCHSISSIKIHAVSCLASSRELQKSQMDPEEEQDQLAGCYCSLLGPPLSVDGHCKVCVCAPLFWESTLLAEGPFKNKNLICLPKKKNDSGFNQKPIGCFVHQISRTPNFPTNQRTQISATVTVNMKTENDLIMIYFKVSETVGKTLWQTRKELACSEFSL